MNKYVIIALLLISASCSKKPLETAKESNVMLEEPVLKVVDSAAAGKHEGLALIEGTDCLTCHKVDARLVGPSY